MSIVVMAAQSGRPDAPGSGALAAAAGPKGKGSMLGPFLNHEHACKVMDKAPLLEITDFCMRKIICACTTGRATRWTM